MNGDLISRKALMKHMKEQFMEWGEEYDAGQILGDIEDFETACDMDRIIEQLEKRKEYIFKEFVLVARAQSVKDISISRINEIDGLIGIIKAGERECGHHRQSARLQDGLLHDGVGFEILAEEFKR